MFLEANDARKRFLLLDFLPAGSFKDFFFFANQLLRFDFGVMGELASNVPFEGSPSKLVGIEIDSIVAIFWGCDLLLMMDLSLVIPATPCVFIYLIFMLV